jgi:hypothetical protein
MARTKAAPTNDVRILSPQPIVWEIGGKVYEQKPLRIDVLGDVIQQIVDVVIDGGRGALIEQLVTRMELEAKLSGVDATNIKSDDLLPTMARIVGSIPRALPKIVAMILGADEKKMLEGLNARQAVQIIRVFIEQNEVAALIQDFFGLMTEMRQGLETATASLGSQEAPSPSDSEAAVSED